jgi:hypothetical protein
MYKASYFVFAVPPKVNLDGMQPPFRWWYTAQFFRPIIASQSYTPNVTLAILS